MLAACPVSAVLFSPTASSSFTVRLLQERRELSDADFRCLALAFDANLTDSLGFEKTKRAADLKGGGLRYPAKRSPRPVRAHRRPGRPFS
jgi:hypothetical protein